MHVRRLNLERERERERENRSIFFVLSSCFLSPRSEKARQCGQRLNGSGNSERKGEEKENERE